MSRSTGSWTNTARLTHLMQAAGMDAVIALSAANLTYTSGFYNMDLTLLPFERLHAAIVDASGTFTFVHPIREEPVETFVQDVVTYDEAGQSGVSALAETIHRRGLASATIGIECEVVPAALLAQLRGQVPQVQWVDAGPVFDETRLIKTDDEIEVLRGAAVATERAIMAGYAAAKPGDTEKQIVDWMGYCVTRNGADFVAFNVMASGPRTTHGHHLAEPVPVERGSIVRVDYGASFGGYYSDLVRMAVLGQPSNRQRDIYRRVTELQDEMTRLCRPGATLKQLWETTIKSHAQRQMPPTRTMFGHSIGLSVHEPPVFDAEGTRELEAGMVLCVEHGWTDRDHRERYHLENMILVTASDPEILSGTTNTDELFVIE